jgi:hypothetical protein
MSKKNLPKALYQGELDIAGFKMTCYNLDTGERVLSREGFLRALGRMGNPKHKEEINDDSELFQTPVFLRASNLKEFVSNELMTSSQPIVFEIAGGRIAYGYKADILPLVCYVYTDAEKAGVLSARQKIYAERSHSLIRGFATVGIISLVDEATGYQQIREKDALQKFLEKFLLEEKGKWIKTFPDEFFEMIFKMKGLTWKTANKGQKPQWVGHHINDFVYSRMAPKVLAELRRVNPKNEKGNRKGKHPQFITTDFGHPKLKEHLAALIALGKGSGYNWNNFKRLIERAFPKFNDDGSQTQLLDFSD